MGRWTHEYDSLFSCPGRLIDVGYFPSFPNTVLNRW
jgi:hypothetical protein